MSSSLAVAIYFAHINSQLLETRDRNTVLMLTHPQPDRGPAWKDASLARDQPRAISVRSRPSPLEVQQLGCRRLQRPFGCVSAAASALPCQPCSNRELHGPQVDSSQTVEDFKDTLWVPTAKAAGATCIIQNRMRSRGDLSRCLPICLPISDMRRQCTQTLDIGAPHRCVLVPSARLDGKQKVCQGNCLDSIGRIGGHPY